MKNCVRVVFSGLDFSKDYVVIVSARKSGKEARLVGDKAKRVVHLLLNRPDLYYITRGK